jgi:hypothetical protein
MKTFIEKLQSLRAEQRRDIQPQPLYLYAEEPLPQYEIIEPKPEQPSNEVYDELIVDFTLKMDII